jgi:hypothetical protein
MKLIIPDTKLQSILLKLIKSEYKGYDDIYYSWADYNCGMGVCCDPYAVGFVLPEDEYDNYFFKLVDGENYDPNSNYPDELSDELPEVCEEQPDITNPEFNVVIFYEERMEFITDFLGSSHIWENQLLDLVNKQFGFNADRILLV